MGACEIGFTRKGSLTIEQIKKEFKNVCEESKSEYGCSKYSGEWNTIDYLRVFDKTFNNENEAEDYCSDKCEKGEAIAVKYIDIDYNKVTSDKRCINIQVRRKDLKQKINDFNQKTFNDLKSAKSKTIACPKCDSKINRSYLKSYICPICGEELRNATIINKLNKLQSNLVELENSEKRIKDALIQKLSEKSKQDKWLVLGLAPS